MPAYQISIYQIILNIQNAIFKLIFEIDNINKLDSVIPYYKSIRSLTYNSLFGQAFFLLFLEEMANRLYLNNMENARTIKIVLTF